MEENMSSFKSLTGKSTGDRPLRRTRLRWEDKIKMDVKEVDVNREWIMIIGDSL